MPVYLERNNQLIFVNKKGFHSLSQAFLQEKQAGIDRISSQNTRMDESFSKNKKTHDQNIYRQNKQHTRNKPYHFTQI